MFQIAPTLDFDRDPNLDLPYQEKGQPTQAPKIEVDRDFNPFSSASTQAFSSKASAQWESLYQEIGTTETEPTPAKLLPYESTEFAVNNGQKIFQLMNSYLVSSTGAALLLIDQERAHQRVLYELFLSNITHSTSSSQQLLFPIELELTVQQHAHFSVFAPLLKEVGFHLGEQVGKQITLLGIPSVCNENKALKVFEELFETVENEFPQDTFSQTDVLAKSLPKTLSIKRGSVLEVEEQHQLINDLFACKDVQLSPFNRQIFVSLTKDELEKKFS